MKNLSIIALISAGVFVAAGALAQNVSVEVSTEVSGEVSVSTPDVSSALSSVASQLSSAVSSVSSEASSALSSVSSEVSSALSSASSELSSALSSEPGPISSMEPMNCGTGTEDLDISSMTLMPIDETALAAVTSVSVVTVSECDGLDQIDGNAQATLSTHPAVIAALAAAGEAGGEIIAYTLSDNSLTVYIRAR